MTKQSDFFINKSDLFGPEHVFFGPKSDLLVTRALSTFPAAAAGAAAAAAAGNNASPPEQTPIQSRAQGLPKPFPNNPHSDNIPVPINPTFVDKSEGHMIDFVLQFA